MNTRSFFTLSLIVALAAAFTFFNVPIAGSQGLTLAAAQVAGDLPLTDPEAAVWQQATAVEVPLSAQTIARPMLLNTHVKSVTARAVHNGTQLAILVEWADETQDDSMVRAEDFRDAVAVQFSLAEAAPFFCMGQPGGNVNVWHWKADWQADLTARDDMQALYPNMYVDQYPFAAAAEPVLVMPADYTDLNYLPALASGNLFASAERASPVEDLIAGGFGSLTAQPAASQNVQGFGVWSQGRWRVIFSRAFASADADDVTFTPGKLYSIAFAAWDGANDERNGQKSTSQWASLQLGGAAPAARPQPAASGGDLDFDDLMTLMVIAGPLVLVGLPILGLTGLLYLISKLPSQK